MKHPVRWVTLSLLAVLVGVPLGYIWGHKSMGHAPATMSQLYALSEYEALAGLQYQEASPAQARAALLGLLEFMHQLETAQGAALGKVFYLDRDITYARLALLEEREGNQQASQTYMQQALKGLNERSESNYTEAHLRDVIATLDAKVPPRSPGLFVFRQSMK